MDEQDTQDQTLSRRAVLGGAGAVVAGGIVVGTGTRAFAHSDGDEHAVARGSASTTVAEYRARIAQRGASGEDFTSIGYLTRLAGANDADLFAGATRNETTALFTAFAAGNLVSRALDQDVHLLDVAGRLTVYQRSAPGASWSDPASFEQGKAVARYTMTIQDVVSVFAPGKGMLDLTADMLQTQATKLSGGLKGRRFGSVGDRLRQHGTGLGTLIDAVKLNSDLEIAGNWAAVDTGNGK